jgi:hypothetical protein
MEWDEADRTRTLVFSVNFLLVFSRYFWRRTKCLRSHGFQYGVDFGIWNCR